MKLRGVDFKIKTIICLALYYTIFRYWPNNKLIFGGGRLLGIN